MEPYRKETIAERHICVKNGTIQYRLGRILYSSGVTHQCERWNHTANTGENKVPEK